MQSVFQVPCQRVAEEVLACGAYVRQEMGRLGKNQSVVEAQYRLQEIDEARRLFTPAPVARMRGAHRRLRQPPPDDELYPLALGLHYPLAGQ